MVRQAPSESTLEKRRKKHAQAQAPYVKRNLEEVREKARIRMSQRLQAKRSKEKAAVAEKRQVWDADYRESQRRENYIEKYGMNAYLTEYRPLYNHYTHLPWVGTSRERVRAELKQLEKEGKHEHKSGGKHEHKSGGKCKAHTKSTQ
ncbi:hypothetical protein FB45DRAFT_1017937 [Roridomyces roridus]|uniref:Uncharacterized protein n=1 Tax=Roridomyces roridus TaxID=1738132 RepID=A0AAD7CJI4_9AGAR|nr:hypothetical protein FB45DRAFT_1017937 [Roridomyces roridus]